MAFLFHRWEGLRTEEESDLNQGESSSYSPHVGKQRVLGSCVLGGLAGDMDSGRDEVH